MCNLKNFRSELASRQDKRGVRLALLCTGIPIIAIALIVANVYVIEILISAKVPAYQIPMVLSGCGVANGLPLLALTLILKRIKEIVSVHIGSEPLQFNNRDSELANMRLRVKEVNSQQSST